MYARARGGGEVPGGLLEGWEQEGTDLEVGDKVAETTWRIRRGGEGGVGAGAGAVERGGGGMETEAGYRGWGKVAP